jgi:hypothetical protein
MVHCFKQCVIKIILSRTYIHTAHTRAFPHHACLYIKQAHIYIIHTYTGHTCACHHTKDVPPSPRMPLHQTSTHIHHTYKSSMMVHCFKRCVIKDYSLSYIHAHSAYTRPPSPCMPIHQTSIHTHHTYIHTHGAYTCLHHKKDAPLLTLSPTLLLPFTLRLRRNTMTATALTATTRPVCVCVCVREYVCVLGGMLFARW